jgi:hypothetical protein
LVVGFGFGSATRRTLGNAVQVFTGVGEKITGAAGQFTVKPMDL